VCGRFSNHVKGWGRWAEILSDWPDDVPSSYNIAPASSIVAFTDEGGNSMRWGLVPAWSKTPGTKYSTFNARAETLTSKPAFRNAWKHNQRCLIPVQGYYEWQSVSGKKQPYYISSADGDPLVCAGLWDQWGDSVSSFLSCTIVTRTAIAAIADIHPRMPLIIEPETADIWLSGPVVECESVLSGNLLPELECHRVSTKVNNTRNDGPELIEDVEH
jgi:putative SOS response-associated peptidase YedK